MRTPSHLPAAPAAPLRRRRLERGPHTAGRAPTHVTELLACLIWLAAVTVVMCATHVARGGFYYDDRLGRAAGSDR